MTEEEKKMAKEYVDTLLDKDDAELDKFLDEYLGDLRLTKKQAGAILGIIKGVGICSYLAGLEAGKEIEKEYVKNNAFTSMKEQGLFPFGKWHKVADGDLPNCEHGHTVFNQDLDRVIIRNGRFEHLDGCPTKVVAWCEIPQYTDKE